MREHLAPAAVGAVLLGVVGLAVWWVAPSPVEAVQGCAACHDAGPGGSHAAVPCEACHAGDPGAEAQEAAHVDLELEPGALDRAARTCGACHPAQLTSVLASRMATGAGIVHTDRAVLGVPGSAATLQEVLAVAEPDPVEDHLRRLCAGCHLHTRRDNRDDAVEGGSGCSACHAAPAEGHSAVGGPVGDERCFGCHSRSGRISLSYAGLAELRPERDCDGMVLADGRAVCRVVPDVHADAGLGCTDCHLHTEVMGAGLELTCEACHADAVVDGPIEDATSLAQLRRAGIEPGSRHRAGRRGTPLWNVVERDGWVVLPKDGGAPVPIPATEADHGGPEHARLSCDACHARWAPTCPECHTAYDPYGLQWDFGVAAEVAGAWVEEGSSFERALPALAVQGGRITTAVPGMVLTVDAPVPTESARHYAALSPHTTGAARSCASCHASSYAVGLGSSAADRWVEPDADVARGPRGEVRSLDRATRARVLQVGRCLGCHEPEDAVFADYGASLDARLECPDAG